MSDTPAPLADRHCVPCRPGTPPLDAAAIEAHLAHLGPGWSLDGRGHLTRSFAFKDFALALAFVNRVGAVAEAEDHHPDVHLAWGKVVLEVWTHAAGGLTHNDFILAARCDGVLEGK